MKTRYKIIIVISLIFVGWMGVTGHGMCIFVDGQQPDWLGSDNGCGPSITYEIQKFFGILWYPEIQNTNTDSEWITDEDYCNEWCDQKELYRLGCSTSILAHLANYSNLLDEGFDGVYVINDVGLPDGISTEKFEECIDIIFEKRTMELENEN